MTRMFDFDSDLMLKLVEFCNGNAIKIKDDGKWQIFNVPRFFQNDATCFLFYSVEKSLMVLTHSESADAIREIIDQHEPEYAIQRIDQLERPKEGAK